MKKFFMTLVLVASSMAQAKGPGDIGSVGKSDDGRKAEVLSFAPKAMNDKKSNLGKAIQAARESGANGFIQDENNVIANVLTAKNIRIAQIGSSDYSGKITDWEVKEGETDPSVIKVDPGYLQLDYLLLIPKNTASYGGRISTTESVLVFCSSLKEDEGQSQIECSLQELKNKQ